MATITVWMKHSLRRNLRKIAGVVWGYARPILRQLGVPKRGARIFWLTHNHGALASSSVKLVRGASGTLNADTIWGAESAGNSALYDFPDIFLHTLHDVSLIAHRRFNAVFVGNQCLIPERTEASPWDFGPQSDVLAYKSLVTSKEMLEVSIPRKNLGIRSGIYIGARAPDNYYHFLVNALPSLFIADNFSQIDKTVPVIVPKSALSKSTLLAALKMVAGDRPVFAWDERLQLDVSEAFVIDPPPVYDTPLSRELSDRRPLAFHMSVMRDYRDAILSRTSEAPLGAVPVERLFLARPSGDRKSPGRAEIVGVVERHGFAVVEPQQLSFEEQVRLFRHARIIVGPGGAAFTNILFCQPGAVSALWKPRHIEAENHFSNLAKISQSHLFSIPLDRIPPVSHSEKDVWDLDPVVLSTILRDLIEVAE